MSGGSNVNNTTIINNYFRFDFGGTYFNNAGGADAIRRSFNLFNQVRDQLDFGYSRSDFQMPFCGCLPPPRVSQSGPPAGQGLQVGGAEGWPANTITDAAGYRIVPEGNTNFSIYAPGQCFGETPHTRVWGDPHVTEKDGTRWDFTKDGEFVLPSGTRIFVDTDYDANRGNGQSVAKRLVCTSGSDRVEVDGVDTAHPTIGPITQDAYEWRAMHLTNPRANGSSKYGQAEDQHDAYHLRGDRDNVHWVRERNGELEGVITGTRQVDAGGHHVYDQQIDPTLDPIVAREMRPPIGSRAWGNAIRSELNDAQAKLWREYFGRNIGALGALGNAYGIHGDHINAEYRADMMDWMFGGLPGYFNAYNRGPFAALYDMVSLLRSDQDWRTQFRNQRLFDDLAYI